MHTPKTLFCLIPMAQPCFSCSWQEWTCPTTFTPTLRHWGGGHRQTCFCNWSWAIEWLLPYPLRHSDLTIHKNKVPGFNYHLRYFKEPHFTFLSDMDYEVCHGPMKDYCFSAENRPATTQTPFYSIARADLTVPNLQSLLHILGFHQESTLSDK